MRVAMLVFVAAVSACVLDVDSCCASVMAPLTMAAARTVIVNSLYTPTSEPSTIAIVRIVCGSRSAMKRAAAATAPSMIGPIGASATVTCLNAPTRSPTNAATLGRESRA